MLSTPQSCGCVSAAALNWAHALGCSHYSLGLQVDGVLVIGVQRLAFLLLKHPSVPTRVQVRQQCVPLQRRTALLIANGAGARRPADVALLLGGAARCRVRQDLGDVDVVVVLNDWRRQQRRLQLILLLLLICVLGELGWTRQVGNAHFRVAHRDS